MERMVILVTSDQKKSISARAKESKLSMGEMVRRAVEGYKSSEDEAMLVRLMDSVKHSTNEAIKAIDEAEREIKRTRTHFAAKKPLRKAA